MAYPLDGWLGTVARLHRVRPTREARTMAQADVDVRGSKGRRLAGTLLFVAWPMVAACSTAHEASPTPSDRASALPSVAAMPPGASPQPPPPVAAGSVGTGDPRADPAGSQASPIDYDLMERESKRLKALGKTPYAAFLKLGQTGTIDLEPGGRVRWGDSVVVFVPPIGWSSACSITFADGTREAAVFLNIGTTPLQVGGVTLAKGQRAVLDSGQGGVRFRVEE